MKVLVIDAQGGMPAIISKDLFERCRVRSDLYRKGAGFGKADEPYILKGKLRCGHCGCTICSESGKSATGKKYRYYFCDNAKKRRNCDKKRMRKEMLEDAVIHDILTELTPTLIDSIAERTAEAYADARRLSTEKPVLEGRLQEVSGKIRNLVSMIEKGIGLDDLTDRLAELSDEKKALEKRIAALENSCETVTADHVRRWIERFIQGDVDDVYFKRKLIEYLIDTVTLYDRDDELLIETVLNTTGRPILSTVGKDGIQRKIDEGEQLYDEGLYVIKQVHALRVRETSILDGFEVS